MMERIAKKILIDLVAIRDYPEWKSEGIYRDTGRDTAFRSIREMATFLFTCRKCQDAPCISVCPSEALEKSEDGTITRFVHLCVGCKSCVAICPFGTLMDDLFEKKDRRYYFDLGDEGELDRLVESAPGRVITYYEGEEDPEQHIYKMTDRIMVRDYVWNPK